MKNISIKYKLLLMLITLPIVTLGLYVLLATETFTTDKIVYVFDSSSSVAKTLSAQVRAELNTVSETLKFIWRGYEYNTKKFSPTSLKQFNEQPQLNSLSVYQVNKSGEIIKLSNLTKPNISLVVKEQLEKSFNDLVYAAQNKGFAMVMGPENESILVGIKLPQSSFITAAYKSLDFVEAFNARSAHTNFLVDAEGKILKLSKNNVFAKDFKFDGSQFFADLKDTRAPAGTTEVTAKNTDDKLLASYAKVGLGGFNIVSMVEKKSALKAVDVLIKKSVFFFLAMVSISIMISVLASRKLTSALRDLYSATRSVAQGKFDINVPVKTKDEIGGLADSFNHMAKEVSRLMAESVIKTRMEKELETARLVQETLFPKPAAQVGNVKINAFYEPASECGGDWWYYFQKGKKVFVIIGDATGHGVPAALITSAARSAVSLIEKEADTTPAKIMDQLNKAIYDCSKGTINMTFFVGMFDEEKKSFTYANASHDPPYFASAKLTKVTRKDLIPLMDVQGPRLGENLASKYEEVSMPVEKGDSIFFYTDGIGDIRNLEDKPWDERGVVSSLTKALEKSRNPEEVVQNIKADMQTFRQNTTLNDDVTFFVCGYDANA